MARFGVNTLKRCAFRNGVQHFGNTYYYEDPLGTPGLSTLDALVDALVNLEKNRFANAVTFVRGRLWSQIGSKEQNVMLVDKDLTGVGGRPENTNIDRERAFLVRFRAGNDSRGRPVFLRKWWHLQADIGAQAITNAQLANTSPLNSTQKGEVETFGNAVKQITVGTPAHTFSLVSKNGREIDGITQAHDWLEHRQLGEEWRGN